LPAFSISRLLAKKAFNCIFGQPRQFHNFGIDTEPFRAPWLLPPDSCFPLPAGYIVEMIAGCHLISPV
jgi:hypothetical protein